MGRLEEAKTLGGIGSILQLVPGVNIVGYILTLIAVKYISDDLQDRSIFDNMLYAIIAAIAGAVFGVVLIIAIFAWGFTTSYPHVGAAPYMVFPTFFWGFFAILGVVWIAFVIASIFIRRAFDSIGTRLNISSFKTAGTLFFVGALLTIVLVGFIVLLVAIIFQIIAFFAIRESQQASAPTATTASLKYCPACGTQLAADAAFCPKCGRKQ